MFMTTVKRAAIIGSGIAGIASAIRLAKKYDVTVYESAGKPGGKLSEIHNGGFRFDAGPSLFTLPKLVEELFEINGKESSKYFRYKRLDNICKYFYEDGTVINAWADQNKFADEVSLVSSVKPEAVLKYLKDCSVLYGLTSELFLEKPLTLKTFVNKKLLKSLFYIRKLNLLSTLNSVNNNNFRDQRIVQLFNRYATYNGSSPYLTPGVMAVIPHLEFNMGAYFPEGGMYSIVKSLYGLALEQGVKFQFNTPVEKVWIEDGVAKGVQVNAEKKKYDAVVCNADIHHAYRQMMPEEKPPERILKQPKSSSAMVFYLNINKEFPDLDLHNIFFSNDYKMEFQYIFEKNEVYDDPTIYVNISSKQCPSDAPAASENWFVMINVPSNSGQNWEEVKERSRNNIIHKLNRLIGVEITDHIIGEEVLDPVLIENKTSSFGGALYGNSSNNRFSAFLRHPNYSSRVKNLYFCGGSVHPGGGIPLCLLSAKIVSELIENDKS